MTADSFGKFERLLSQAVSGADEDIDLPAAALYIAATEYPDLDIGHYTGVLDSLAAEVAPALRARDVTTAAVRSLSRHLSEDKGFSGNAQDYYDPRNSYLNEVLDRRTGIPITLSVVYMGVADKLGITLEGIGLPGHFVLRAGPVEDELYVDPYNGGRILTMSDCEAIVGNMFGGRVKLQGEHLRPYTKKEILVRILANLKQIYFRSQKYRKAIAAADLVETIDPAQVANLRERASIYHTAGEFQLAIRDLESYLNLAPNARDTDDVKSQIEQIWAVLHGLE